MVDDYGGYKALFASAKANGQDAIVEVGCWAHVRRKFFELHVASQSTLAQTALERIGQLYGIEREIVELKLNLEQATAHRQQHAKPLLVALHAWLLAQRQVLTDGVSSGPFGPRRGPAPRLLITRCGVGPRWCATPTRPACRWTTTASRIRFGPGRWAGIR